MTQIERPQAYFNGIVKEHRESNKHLLDKLGFNGERVTLLKYVVPTDIPGVYRSRFGRDVLWEVGQRTEEENWNDGLIGMNQGLYAAGTSYFIRKGATDLPILLVEMVVNDFINTDGEVVVSKALKPIDVFPGGLPRLIQDAYCTLSPERKRVLGQVYSWKEFISVVNNPF